MSSGCQRSPTAASEQAGQFAANAVVRSEELRDGDRVIVTKLSNAIDGLLVNDISEESLPMARGSGLASEGELK